MTRRAFSVPRASGGPFELSTRETVKILEGGLAAWKAEGRALESGPVERPFAKFHRQSRPRWRCRCAKGSGSFEERSSQIVDARQAARFRGETVEPRPGVRSGHIPGSVNVPYRELLNDGRLKAPQEIKQIFVQAGVDLARPIITTCGSGVTAAILLLALESIGKKGVVPLRRILDRMGWPPRPAYCNKCCVTGRARPPRFDVHKRAMPIHTAKATFRQIGKTATLT